MPAKNQDLHGNAPDKSPVVLLIIDMINDMEFPGGEALFAQALPAARRIAALKQQATALDIPTIYVNDNFGRWQSNFSKLVRHVRGSDVRGRPLADLLAPDDDDYFVLKPKNSGFFSTVLDTLLEYLHARTLIITGVATDSCVLFTAGDAYIRDFHLAIPTDCVAANDAESHAQALALMRRVLKADTTPSTDLDLRALLDSSAEDEELRPARATKEKAS